MRQSEFDHADVHFAVRSKLAGYWRPVAAKYAALPKSDAAEILWWFATIFGTACAYKLYFLSTLYFHGGLEFIAGNSTGIARVLKLLPIFSSDAISAGLLVGVVYLIGHRLLRLNFNVVMLVIALLWLMLGAANLLSQMEVGTNLTLDVLDIALAWSWSNPTVIKAYYSRPALLFLLLNLAWCTVPFLLTRAIKCHGGKQGSHSRFWVACTLGVLGFVVAGALALADRERFLNWWWAYIALIAAAATAPYYLRIPIPWASLAARFRRLALGTVIVVVIVSGTAEFARMFQSQAKVPIADRGQVSALVDALFTDQAADSHIKNLPLLSLKELRDRYRKLAYTGDAGPPVRPLVALPAERLQPRHVLVVGLETAFLKQYRLFDDPTLPNLYAMSRHAIVSELHHATVPVTKMAGFTILSGLYPMGVHYMSDKDSLKLRPDSLPIVLAKHGYDSTYVDSFLTDWVPKHGMSAMYRGLGFDRLYDISTAPGYDRRNKSFAEKQRLEGVSFDRAWESIRASEAEGRKAFVYLMTNLGHFPWPAARGHESDPPAKKFHAIEETFDRLFGILLARLKRAGLSDKVIVVVMGDHGLRAAIEFNSLGEKRTRSDLAFIVPLMISAPGLLDRQIKVPFVTSHVDIAPTLLGLLGIPTKGLFYQGLNMLDGVPSNRVTFMFNYMVSPVDEFHWNGLYFTFNKLSGEAQVASNPARTDARPLSKFVAGGTPVPDALRRPEITIESARELFYRTIAYFLNRGRQIHVARQ